MNMDTDTRNRLLEVLGIAESIAMMLRDIEQGRVRDDRTSCEYADMARAMSDIEDRLYRKDEYAPENVADLQAIARSGPIPAEIPTDADGIPLHLPEADPLTID